MFGKPASAPYSLTRGTRAGHVGFTDRSACWQIRIAASGRSGRTCRVTLDEEAPAGVRRQRVPGHPASGTRTPSGTDAQSVRRRLGHVRDIRLLRRDIHDRTPVTAPLILADPTCRRGVTQPHRQMPTVFETTPCKYATVRFLERAPMRPGRRANAGVS